MLVREQLLAGRRLAERALEAVHIGVLADQARAAPHDRVDRADPPRVLAGLVHVPQHALLVRDRDVRAEHVITAQRLDEILELVRLDVARLVVVWQAERGERGVVHRRRE